MSRTLFAFAVLLAPQLYGQDVGRFLDYQDHFFVFDRGIIKELDHLPPRSSAISADRLVYAASNGDLKVYHQGKVTTVDQSIATKPTVTDNYLGYVTAGVMKIYDGDSLYMLCRNTGAFVVEDSVAAFYDEVQRTLSIFYRGATTQVEDALMENPVQRWSAGDNIIAWTSKITSEFKVFYHGEVQVLASLVTDMPFTAGLDMVAYRDPSDRGLKAFHKGEVIDVDAFMPEQVYMGKGLFAYQDRSGALKVFQDGTIYTASDFAPEEFQVRDSLVVIRDKGQMRVFHNGETTTVVPYFPAQWRVSWGILAWLDTDGTMKAWRNGKIHTIMQREPVKGFSLDRGLVTINLTNNKVKIWWKGNVYEQ